MSYIEENSNKNNKQSIQILRGSNDTIANSTDKLLDGQLLYNKDKNYLTVGKVKKTGGTIDEDNSSYNFTSQPIRVRELGGFSSDDSSIGEENTGEFYIKHDSETSALTLSDSSLIKFKAGENEAQLGGKSVSFSVNTPRLRIEQNSSGDFLLDGFSSTSAGSYYSLTLSGDSKGSSFYSNRKLVLNSPNISFGRDGSGVVVEMYGTLMARRDGSRFIGVLGGVPEETRNPIYCTSISSTEIESGTIKGQLGTEDPSTRHSIYCTSINCSSITSTGVVTVNNNIKCGDKITLNSTTGEITAQSFNAQSDARLKTNIKPLTYHDSILDIPVREYDWKESGKHAIGFIAQELKEVYPELVDENEEGILSIKETKLVYLLMEEVRKLKEEIQELKK